MISEERPEEPVHSGTRMLAHLLGNVAVQAIGLAWLYADWRRNSLKPSMAPFLVPLGASALYFVGGLAYWDRKGKDAAAGSTKAVLYAGIGVTLFVYFAAFIEGSI
jgi:hypothetical protein